MIGSFKKKKWFFIIIILLSMRDGGLFIIFKDSQKKTRMMNMQEIMQVETDFGRNISKRYLFKIQRLGCKTFIF